MLQTRKNTRPGAMTRYYQHRAARALSGVRLKALGALGNCRVWLVDGELIRNTIDTDFTMGGTDGRYSYIPACEIWLDKNLSILDRQATLLHEMIERDLMVGRGWTYNRAHDRATEVEQQLRALLQYA